MNGKKRRTATLTLLRDDKIENVVKTASEKAFAKIPQYHFAKELLLQEVEDRKYYTGSLALLDIEGFMPPFQPFFVPDPSKQYMLYLDTCLKSVRKSVAGFERQPETYTDEAKIEVLRQIREIGLLISKIYEHFPSIMSLLKEHDVTHLLIYTNDISIPWQWCYNKGTGNFLCEDFALGQIFVENLDESLEKWRRWLPSVSAQEGTPDSTLANKSAVLIGGFYGDDKSRAITHEIKTLERMFRGEGLFAPEKVYTIHKVESHRDKLLTLMEEVTSTAKIIHYGGLIEQDKLLMSTDTADIIAPEFIRGRTRIFNFASYPLVFLNGCNSGEIDDVWNKAAQLSTAFLDANASGCVVTSLPVGGNTCVQMASDFYAEVLDQEDPCTYGEALQRAVRKSKDRDLWDPMRLFFVLYGDPRSQLIYPSPFIDRWRQLLEKRRARREVPKSPV